MSKNIRTLAVDGLLTTLLIIIGMIKLPSLIPGTEFQLSAPYAVCVAAAVGFGRYLRIGICASIVQLLLGTHTIWNVVIAMVFRIVVGIVVTLFPDKKIVLCLSGPMGTAAARIVTATMLHVPALPLITAAVPGMLFTVVGVLIMQPIFNKIMKYYEPN